MIIIPMLIGVAGFGLFFSLGYVLLQRLETQPRNALGRRPSRPARSRPGAARPDTRSDPGERADPLPTLTRLLITRPFGRRLTEDLAQAGMNLRPGEFLAGVLTLGVGLATLNVLLFHSDLALMAGPVEALLLGRMKIAGRKKKRLAAFEAQLADALTLMSSAIRSGYSFLQGVQLVSQEMTPPISEEMDRVWRQAALGVSMQDSLRAMATRVPSMDLDLVVTAVQIQLETGGNLSEILNIAAATIQERERMRREIDVLTSEGKFSAKALAITPIAIGIMMWRMAPVLMQPFIESMAGKLMLAGAAFFELVGWLVMKRMADLDV